MARVPNYTPFDHLGAAKAVGGSIAAIPEQAGRAFIGGVQVQQKMQADELQAQEQKDRIDAAKKSKKLFEKEKQNLIDEWRGVLRDAPNDWAEKQIKYLETAGSVDQLVERNANMAMMLQTNKDLNKKYPYLSFQNPDPAGAGNILGKDAAKQYIQSQQDLATTSNRQFIDKSVKQILATNPKITEEQAMRKFAEMHKVDEVSLDKEARAQIKDAFISQGELLAAQTARIKAKTQKEKSTRTQNVATNKAFVRLNTEENKLAKNILSETNMDVRNLDDMGQFFDSDAWKNLSAEKKDRVSKMVEKLDDARTKKKIAVAARELGFAMDDAQIEGALNDIMDGGRPSTERNKRIAEHMATRQGVTLPDQTGEPDDAVPPDQSAQPADPKSLTDEDLVKQILEQSKGN